MTWLQISAASVIVLLAVGCVIAFFRGARLPRSAFDEDDEP